MKTSNILIKAKKLLAKDRAELNSGKLRYICYAIDVAAIPGKKKKEALLDLIQERLGLCPDLESWLQVKHSITRKYISDATYDDYIDNLQLTRHAWIDSMIAEFQANGN